MSIPLISLCMIVKNEEESLPGCLESVRGLVDEIIVVDTGSTDNTAAVAESLGARVFHMSWPGSFAEARNKSLEYARGNWVLYLDADERLDTGGRADCIRRAASDLAVDAYSVPIRNHKHGSEAQDIGLNFRLFRNLPEIRFENEVHERVEPALARMGAKISVAPFFIDHFGYRLDPDAMKEKLERNLLLSQKHLERDPNDPYCLYYAGATLLMLGKTAEGREFFQRALDSKDLPRYLEAMSCNLMAYLNLLEENDDEVLALAERSITLEPVQNSAYLLCGLALFRKSDFSSALPLLSRSFDFTRLPFEERRSGLSMEYAFIGESEFHKLLTVCLSETGRFKEALRDFRKYLELGGNEPEIIRRGGVCFVNAQDFASGLKYLEEAERLGISRSEVVLPMAFSCLKLKDFPRAKRLLDEAEKISAGDVETISKMKKMLESEWRVACPGVKKARGIRVSLCMIAKNEEERLPGCLESVRGLVDEIIVVDTGSSDKTQEIARAYGARVFHFPWSGNFAAARNESLRHASGDWVLFLDADERLNTHATGDGLRKAAATCGLDALVIPILNRHVDGKGDFTIGSAIRFFRNFPGIRFSGRVHENVDRFLAEAGARTGHGDFAIEHLGYALDPETVRKKYERNLELLEKELAENPADANSRYHLGLTLMALKREREAMGAFDQALRGTGLTPPLEAMIRNMKSYLHLRAGELDPALETASRSLALVAVQNTARLLKGLVFFQKGAYGDALPLLLEAYRFVSLPPRERRSDIYFEDTIDKLDLIEKIGTCFAETGRFDDAIPFLKLAASTRAGAILFERLGVCLLNSGNFSEALEYLLKAQAGGQEPNSLALPLSFASFRIGDFERAASYFCRAKPKDHREVSVAFQLIRAMAAEDAFRPHLKDCVRSKLDSFRRAFPDELRKFISGVEKSALFPQTLHEQMEA